jgi:hypothetical protein
LDGDCILQYLHIGLTQPSWNFTRGLIWAWIWNAWLGLMAYFIPKLLGLWQNKVLIINLIYKILETIIY